MLNTIFYTFWKWLLCNTPIKSYEILNIAMYDIIQLYRDWAHKDCNLCVILIKKQMLHNTSSLPNFHWKKECLSQLCLVWLIFRKNISKTEKFWPWLWLIFLPITQNHFFHKVHHLVMLKHIMDSQCSIIMDQYDGMLYTFQLRKTYPYK